MVGIEKPTSAISNDFFLDDSQVVKANVMVGFHCKSQLIDSAHPKNLTRQYSFLQ
jgi:hypothetical protein